MIPAHPSAPGELLLPQHIPLLLERCSYPKQPAPSLGKMLGGDTFPRRDQLRTGTTAGVVVAVPPHRFHKSISPRQCWDQSQAFCHGK